MAFDQPQHPPQRIAVIGGGISGLSSAWLLSEHNHVTLYEAAPRLGGHARTVLAGRNGDQPVDTGFIVFNYATYPHLTRLFQDLDVPVEKSDMSFAVSARDGAFEYALQSVNSLFGQRRNLMRPGFYRMLRDIMRFNERAEAAASDPDMTIDALVAELGLSRQFRDNYLRPFCAAIWSTPAEQIGAFPAQSLLRFLRNHALLSATGQHQWWTVSGGSRSYVDRLTAALTGRDVVLRANTPVTRVERRSTGVTIHTAQDEPRQFDQVVMACHADTSLHLLGAPTAAEQASLGAIRFQDNHALLHRDTSVMPKRRRCWAAWVYREPAATTAPLGVTYWMNRLQNIPESDPLFVTLNGAGHIDEAKVYDAHTFCHPVFDRGALRAQEVIKGMQGDNRTWFAGAWLRNGFHEDGIASAHRISRAMSRQTVGQTV